MSCVAGYCVILALYTEHFYFLHPSLLLNVFLSITVVFDAIKTYSLFNRSIISEAALQAVIVASRLVLILLEEVSKRSLFISKELQTNTGREAVSGFWSRALFTWLNATFWIGAKTVLRVDDLDKLDQDLQAANIAQRFRKYWGICKNAVIIKYSLLY